ncbi:MAG: M1 family metallopeptidase [Deltaproteobacteria bacterium]|nr:M1 family metallopeptidase [Deltaproteobacteria bacterium]
MQLQKFTWAAGCLAFAACAGFYNSRTKSPTPPSDRLDLFVRTILDANRDGVIGPTEATPAQLGHLINGKGGKEVKKAGVDEVLDAVTRNVGGDPKKLARLDSTSDRLSRDGSARLARFFTETFKDPKENRLALSAYSAARLAQGLSLVVEECEIRPDSFQKSLQQFFGGKSMPTHPTLISSRPRQREITDPYTASNYREVPVRHLSMELTFDFENKKILGEAAYLLEPHDQDQLILDTRALSITRVWVKTEKESAPIPVTPIMGEEKKYLGRPLIIDLPPDTTEVHVEYETKTDERAPGLQWLDPEQTSSGKKPFFFTQGQYFHNRGLVPLQDTPNAKITVDMKLKVKWELGLRVVASGDEPHAGTPQVPQKEGDYDVWNYKIGKPVSPYLIAIAAGEIEAHRISDRSILYAEPSIIETAARDYARYNEFLTKAEELLGPMVWSKIDTLIMPGSFPFGGMENLGLNMNSNTIITGDGSLIDVAIHELIHSWFGNLVTNSRIEDFWLNEGLTMYAQRAVMEEIFGDAFYQIDSVLGRQEIEEDLRTVGESQKSCLATKLPFENPDEAITSIPYEKGYLFAEWLESKTGRKNFLGFLRGYLNEFQFRNLTTEDFSEFLSERIALRPLGISQEEIDAWLYGPGLPEEVPVFRSGAMERTALLARQWGSPGHKDFTIPESEQWSAPIWVYFLKTLFEHEKLPAPALESLKNRYHLDDRTNAEISGAWQLLVVRNQYRPSYPGLERFLDGRIGRAKFVTPLFKELVKTGQREQAQKLYDRIKPKLHGIVRELVEKELKQKI